MMISVLAKKFGRTKARLSRKLSKRRESIASRTTENMDQAKESIGITVPNSLGRQLPTWSQTVTSASTTLENIAGKATSSRQSNIQGVPKKQGLVFRAHFRGLNDLKIIKVEENRPHLKLLGGVFRPVCRL